MDSSFDPVLIEKLIPWVNKPVAEHAITALTAGMDRTRKALLKTALQQCWVSCDKPIDHRKVDFDVEVIVFGQLKHHVCADAIDEFKRLKKLYKDTYTEGLKASLDKYVDKLEQKRKLAIQNVVSGWRIGEAPLADFRRRDGERILVDTHVFVVTGDQRHKARTADISEGGCLVCFAAGHCPPLNLSEQVSIEYVELSSKYNVQLNPVYYEVVGINPNAVSRQLALKRIKKPAGLDDPLYAQMFTFLMQDNKRRHRLDVDNTVKALMARSQNMAAVTQLNALMVLSHAHNRYHLLITQGQSLNLQAQLLLEQSMIPHMVELTRSGESELFYVWANDRHAVYVARLSRLIAQSMTDEVLGVWGTSSWHKAFLVKADQLDGNSAEQGTSLPCHIAPTISRLNAPLPDKVAQLSEGLNKISLIEDVSYLVDAMSVGSRCNATSLRKFHRFRVKRSKGFLRQVPFNYKDLPVFEGTFRFGRDCVLQHGDKTFVIVNGYADNTRGVLFLSLNDDPPQQDAEVVVIWDIEGILISLAAKVQHYDQVHKTAVLEWQKSADAVKQLFEELGNLEALLPAFKADICAHKLDMAMRNLILSHLPKVSIFASADKQTIAIRGLTGSNYLPPMFIDSEARIKLDELFSRQILQKLAASAALVNDILVVAVKNDKVLKKQLMSDYKNYFDWLHAIRELSEMTRLFIFSLDVTPMRPLPDDAIIKVERKYLDHYNPAKSAKVDQNLNFSLSIQMVDISDLIYAILGPRVLES